MKWGLERAMGRRGTPTAIKVMRGNPGKRPLNDAEPRPDATMPQCPRHLTKEARTEWHRVARRLHVVGVLTYVDRGILAAYCQAYGRWVEAEQQVARGGALVVTPNGHEQQSPWLGIANRAQEQMVRAARELGMTPASRSAIKVERPAESLSDILLGEVG
jgi:P27 family predicted phage terminase small subunit